MREQETAQRRAEANEMFATTEMQRQLADEERSAAERRANAQVWGRVQESVAAEERMHAEAMRAAQVQSKAACNAAVARNAASLAKLDAMASEQQVHTIARVCPHPVPTHRLPSHPAHAAPLDARRATPPHP